MDNSKDRMDMQGSSLPDADEWAMPERRERAVMQDVPPAPKGKADDGDFKFPTGRGVLSKAEIEALLRPNLPKINEEEAAQTVGQPVEKAFEDVEGMPAADGRRLASRLSLLFAQASGLRAAFRFERSQHRATLDAAFADRQASRESAYVCFGPGGDTVSHVLEIPARLGAVLVSHACGGPADPDDQAGKRPFSAIDCALIEQLLTPLRAALSRDVVLVGVETDPDFVASLIAGVPGDQVWLTVNLAGQAIGLSLLAADPAVFQHAAAQASSSPYSRPVSAVLTARLASLSVPVSRLRGLKAGDTLLLGLPSDQPVQLLSGGRDGVPAFEGDIGRKGANMAIRIRKTLGR